MKPMGAITRDPETMLGVRFPPAKAQINRFGSPTTGELQSSNDMIFSLLAAPSAQARRPKLRGIGADDRNTGTQPG